MVRRAYIRQEEKHNILKIKKFDMSVKVTSSDEFVRHEIDASEPLLQPSLNRFVLDEPEYPEIQDMAIKQRTAMWFPDEIDLENDMSDWSKLTHNEQNIIKCVQAFFATSDGIVSENLAVNFLQKVQCAEARLFYSYQIGIEAVHAETYAKTLRQFVPDVQEQRDLFYAIQTHPGIKRKAQWALSYINNENLLFRERLISMICVEGIFFSSSFAIIFWLKSRGLMPGLTHSNELISRDEALHSEFGCLLHDLLKFKTPEGTVHEIFQEAVEAEIFFVTNTLSSDVLGLSRQSLISYVKYVADYWLKRLGYTPLFFVKNPLPYMESISIEGKTNFFERRVSEYKLCPNELSLSIFETVDNVEF